MRSFEPDAVLRASFASCLVGTITRQMGLVRYFRWRALIPRPSNVIASVVPQLKYPSEPHEQNMLFKETLSPGCPGKR